MSRIVKSETNDKADDERTEREQSERTERTERASEQTSEQTSEQRETGPVDHTKPHTLFIKIILSVTGSQPMILIFHLLIVSDSNFIELFAKPLAAV